MNQYNNMTLINIILFIGESCTKTLSIDVFRYNIDVYSFCDNCLNFQTEIVTSTCSYIVSTKSKYERDQWIKSIWALVC